MNAYVWRSLNNLSDLFSIFKSLFVQNEHVILKQTLK